MPATRFLTAALIPVIACGALALGGCGETVVTRTSSEGSKDLSGRWNDVDAKKVASDMISKSTEDPWADAFIAKNKRNPIVKLGQVTVRTDGEFVSTAIFLKEIRKVFIKSGKVDVKDDATQTRTELTDQSGFADKPKEMAKELAPDFLLKGSIDVQNDSEGRESVKYYAVNLELTDVQSGRIIWTDDTKIRKEVSQSHYK
jgi:uncharacterized protein (TIGR02722 family)